jgi:hypothetical protein
MKGQCLTKCGLDVDYEPIEFSDGFVYYLPRNLDKTVHNCFMISNDVVNVVVEGIEPEDCTKDNNVPILKRIYEKNKGTGLTYTQFCSFVKSLQENPTTNFWEGDCPFDMSLVWMLTEGRMLDAKCILEKQMTSMPAPFFQSREDPILGNMCGDTQLKTSYGECSNALLADMVYLNLPTNMGYQLEHLGLLYELMIRIEDSKKCFELQYECTGEPELKKYVEKLDKSIEEKNIRYPKNNNLSTEKLTRDTTLEILIKTEENVRKYLFELYNGDIKEIWSRFPNIKKSVDAIRQKNQQSLTPPEEKTPIQHIMMGQLSEIMQKSNNQRPSDRDDKCKKCGEKYYKKDMIFFQSKENIETKNKTLIICKNQQCFETQGGLHKNIPEELVSLFQLLTSVRNILTHATEEDLKKDQTSWEIRFNSVAGDCRLLNYYLEKINANKKYA